MRALLLGAMLATCMLLLIYYRVKSKTKILVIDEVLPNESWGSGQRMLSVLHSLQYFGADVVFLSRGCNKYEAAWPLLRHVSCYCSFNKRQLLALLKRYHFEMAILSLWFWHGGVTIPEHYAPLIREHSPNTKIVVFSDDAHFFREQSLNTTDARTIGKREKKIYKQADAITAVSNKDIALWKGMFPQHTFSKLRIYKLSCVMQHVQARAGLPFAARRDLLFVANMVNPTNRVAVIWFLKHVFPLIRQRIPDVVLRVVGSMPNLRVTPINDIKPWRAILTLPDVEWLGMVKDLAPVLDSARVFISPIQASTGVNTKNLLAMQHGVPLVTTSIGAQSLELPKYGSSYMLRVANDPAEFAAHVVQLYTDLHLWNTLHISSREHYQSRFSEYILREQVREFLNKEHIAV